MRHRVLIAALLAGLAATAQEPSTGALTVAAGRAFSFFRDQVAYRGGYLWEYLPDLSRGWGEGDAPLTTVWVQKPGTPAVGLAYLRMYDATGDVAYLDAARETGLCLAWGQLASGGWNYRIDFEPADAARWLYRRDVEGGNRPGGRRRNWSVLDDDTTQIALRFLIELDRRLEGREPTIRRTVSSGLEALLAAQYPSGGWAQGFEAPADPTTPVLRARYPAEWPRTPPRNHDYWRYYTLNDNTLRDCIDTCLLAHEAYGEGRYLDAAMRGAEFILAAQMPEPQPVWAQQYNLEMEPIWARRFEPPSVTAGESCGVMRILVEFWLRTGDAKYLAPLPAALRWLRESQIAPDRWARFYELRTNRPLYFVKDTYELTYDGGNVPTHYSFSGDYAGGTIRFCQDAMDRGREALLAERAHERTPAEWAKRAADLAPRVQRAMQALDAEGRWIADGRIDVQTFVDSMTLFADYLEARGKAG